MYIDLSKEMAIQYLLDDYNASWSYEEAYALVSYYEEIELDSGEPMELDRTAIRCYWTSYTLDELKTQYSHIDGMDEMEDAAEAQLVLDDHTQTISVDKNRLLVLDF
jgi:hypothetical protein